MKMIMLLAMPIILFAACVKNDPAPAIKCDEVTTVATASEVTTLKAYLDTNLITYTQDTRGFFYHMDSVGTGGNPNICSYVTVSYAGTLLNGTLFDQSPSAAFYLSQLIVGWQEAIPLMKQGGRMTLFIPPSLGYGSQAFSTIPANSNLKFIITLRGIN